MHQDANSERHQVQEADDIQSWVKVFKKEFKFVGGEIVNEFLMSIGRIEGSHSPDCFRYNDYIHYRKKWQEKIYE